MGNNHLYTEEDNINFTKQVEEVTSKIVKENTELASTQLDNSQLYDDIKNVFEKDKKVVRDSVYFTLGKGKKVFDIDGTVFAPAPIALISGKRFEELYMKQLESLIYTDKDSLNTDALFTLIYIFNHINKKQYPITITSNKNNKLRDKIVGVMNMYFNKNYAVISSMNTMVTSLRDSEKERQSNKQE